MRPAASRLWVVKADGSDGGGWLRAGILIDALIIGGLWGAVTADSTVNLAGSLIVLLVGLVGAGGFVHLWRATWRRR